ncbi:hypothetical protein [uncultured Adlercreutzia sp.]|uniref:hypothetical protein n=1 Tax=uncultured Adlercreutzia sp. TaxID=875803 RepID=UPI00258A09B6|nr:hypothetical protein [uncultured Adlercreutzia sp.]
MVDFYDNVTLHFAKIDDFAAFHGFRLTSSWQADVKPPQSWRGGHQIPAPEEGRLIAIFKITRFYKKKRDFQVQNNEDWKGRAVALLDFRQRDLRQSCFGKENLTALAARAEIQCHSL